MRIFYVEFYDRKTGHLEHNDIYTTMDDAFADAQGREVVVTHVEEDHDYVDTALEEGTRYERAFGDRYE